jgi:hypothetical protein
MCGRLAVAVQASPDGNAGRAAARASRARLSGPFAGGSASTHPVDASHDARARQVGDMIDALERLPRLLGRCDRHYRDQCGRRSHARQRKAAAHAERIEAPERPQQRSRNQARDHQLHLQARKHREQERKRIAIDDQEVEERQRQLQNSELEVRQHDQDHEQSQRQRGADAGALQHDQQEAVHEDPRQHGQRDRKRPVFGGEQDRQRRQMHGNDQPSQRKEPDTARFRTAFTHSGSRHG